MDLLAELETTATKCDSLKMHNVAVLLRNAADRIRMRERELGETWLRERNKEIGDE